MEITVYLPTRVVELRNTLLQEVHRQEVQLRLHELRRTTVHRRTPHLHGRTQATRVRHKAHLHLQPRVVALPLQEQHPRRVARATVRPREQVPLLAAQVLRQAARRVQPHQVKDRDFR
jgi:hypothetical protein